MADRAAMEGGESAPYQDLNMRFLGQRLMAAAVGVLALSAMATAQTPAGSSTTRPAKTYRMAMPGEAAPAPVADEVTWRASTSAQPVLAVQATTAPEIKPVAVGCANGACATPAASSCADGSCGASKTSILSGVKARLFSAEYGVVNPVGCGTCGSERTFLFGSCCQFFTPGRDCGSCNNGHCGSGYWSKCNRMIYGPGTVTPMNPCVYDSYLNH